MQPEPGVTVTQPDAKPPAMTETVAVAAKPPWYAPILKGDLEAMWPAIVAAFLAVLVIAFAMSYHGLFIVGDKIMEWALWLCAVAPLGLDVFSIVGLLATFLTHDAPWRVRAYCWGAFGLTVALSVAGNVVSAMWHLDHVSHTDAPVSQWGYQQVSTVAGAAVWPALSAIALHVLIVVRRHLDRKRDKINSVAEQARADEVAEQLLRARAIELAATGATAAAILADLQLPSKKLRTVERWTEPIRTALAGPKTVVAAKSTTSRRTTSVRTDS